MMHGPEKSDSAIVAVKPTNKAEQSAAEPVEPRAGTKGNADQQSTRRAQDRESVSQALERIRQAARQRKKERFTALLHHISIDLLRDGVLRAQARRRPRRGRADVAGLRGRPRAQASRTCTPGSNGERTGRCRPGGATYRSRTAGSARSRSPPWRTRSSRRATAAVLNAIYEEDFLGFSYGFRPGRGQHDALDALVRRDQQQEGELHTGRRHPVVLRRGQPGMAGPLPGASDRRPAHHPPDPEMAKAGVLEDGVVTVSDRGTGQGSVISPLLANIYLHYVFDLWAERWRRREATGDMIIVRYADDFIVGFQHEADARRFRDAMRERLREFCAVAASGEDPADRVRPLCGGTTASGAGSASRRPSTSWASPSSAANPAGATSRSSGRPGATACGRSSRRSRRSCDGACTSRSPNRGNGWGRSSPATSTTTPCRPTVAALDAFRHHVTDLWRRTLRRRSQKDRDDVGADDAAGGRLAPQTAHPSSLAERALCRHTPEVGAVCGNSARTDLCGGRSAMGVPTAIRKLPALT